MDHRHTDGVVKLIFFVSWVVVNCSIDLLLALFAGVIGAIVVANIAHCAFTVHQYAMNRTDRALFYAHLPWLLIPAYGSDSA
tara:strand:+ start:10766 stop:11011 length:246 start_codon:yes stop_codon:yes gene_type:complete